MNNDLQNRTGWPDDLRFLLERYPRDCWVGHANLGAMVRFWLQRHDMFRELGGALSDATAKFREGILTPRDFQGWFAPRLQFFLQQLHAHHHIEDEHYFPIFSAAERRLSRGFEVLENDHEILHRAIGESVDSANAFLRVLQASDADRLRTAADGYADVSGKLLKSMLRHLEDEEDLIVPLILDRGEGPLGVG